MVAPPAAIPPAHRAHPSRPSIPPTHAQDAPATPAPDLLALRDFVTQVTRLVSQPLAEPALLAAAGDELKTLIARDDWLPPEMAQPHPQFYRQYLLHADPLERFSVVSFGWGPGQRTPVHDHTVWGLIGLLRGQEVSQPFGLDAQGRLVAQGQATLLTPGQVEAVSPGLGDIHQVHNPLADQVSVSIHVYGANIGAVRCSAGCMPRTAAASPLSRAMPTAGCPISGTARKPAHDQRDASAGDQWRRSSPAAAPRP